MVLLLLEYLVRISAIVSIATVWNIVAFDEGELNPPDQKIDKNIFLLI